MKHVPVTQHAPLANDRVSEFVGECEYLATGSVQDNGIIAPELVTYESRPSRADLSVKLGDVCFARMKATRKVLRIDEASVDAILSTGFAVLRPNPQYVYSGYLRSWVASDAFQFAKDRLCTGATQKAITNAKIKTLPIPLPPLAEQKRIAGILDAADALRARRREALAQLDILLQSTFLDMFGDPVTNPKGWKVTRIGHATQMGTGSTPSRNQKNYFDGSIPWVKSMDVNWGTVTATSECLSSDGVKAARLKLYPKGSIILALYGQGKTRGKCAILGIDATINQACCALVPRDPNCTQYLFEFLKYSYHRLRGESRGGNQENLNMGIVRRFPVPFPPLDFQRRYADLAKSVEKQRTSQLAHLAELDTLMASLQSRAFDGDL